MHEKIAGTTSVTQQLQISKTKLNYANLHRQNAATGKVASARDASMHGQLASAINSAINKNLPEKFQPIAWVRDQKLL